MKRTLLILIVSTTTIFICKAQVIHTGDFVKITLPNNARKLNKQQVENLYDNTSFNKSSLHPYLYEIDEKTLGLFNVSQQLINNDLQRQKKFEDEMALFLKKNGNYTYRSFIKKTGINQVLIITYTIHDKGYLRFYCQNEAKTLTQAGKIDYKEADSIKANALLDEILKTIQFTK